MTEHTLALLPTVIARDWQTTILCFDPRTISWSWRESAEPRRERTGSSGFRFRGSPDDVTCPGCLPAALGGSEEYSRRL
jgi:hypothetical protein